MPTTKRSPLARRRARQLHGVLRGPASAKIVARSGTGYYAMHLGAKYAMARRRFSPEQLLANGEPAFHMRRQGAPVADMKGFYSKQAITRASQRVAAEKRRRVKKR